MKILIYCKHRIVISKLSEQNENYLYISGYDIKFNFLKKILLYFQLIFNTIFNINSINMQIISNTTSINFPIFNILMILMLLILLFFSINLHFLFLYWKFIIKIQPFDADAFIIRNRNLLSRTLNTFLYIIHATTKSVKKTK